MRSVLVTMPTRDAHQSLALHDRNVVEGARVEPPLHIGQGVHQPYLPTSQVWAGSW